MGMYNEVFKSCPDCGRLCEIQIRQIVLGFGGFNLDDPDSVAEKLTKEQLMELHEIVSGETFWCGDCYHGFTI